MLQVSSFHSSEPASAWFCYQAPMTKPSEPDTILHRLVREAPDLRPTTKRVYLVDVNAWITFAGTDPANWTRHTAKEFYAHLLTRMKARSANRVLAALRYVGHWYATEAADPNLDFSVIRHKTVGVGIGGTSKEGKALTTDEAQRLLEAVVADRWKASPRVTRDLALFVVALETGMRRMSLESMQLERLRHPDAQPTTTIIDVQVKGREDLYPVALSTTALAALAPWLAFLRSRKIEQGPIWRSLNKHSVGEGFTAQSVYNQVQRYGQAAGVELTPHTFRHTFVSWRLASGWTPQQIGATTGHQIEARGAAGNIGVMWRYVDPSIFWPSISTATPEWLTEFVRRHGGES